MTAYRVVDDHSELDNIGTNSHDQIDSHIDTTPFVIVSGAVGNIPSNARLLSGSGIAITDGGPGGNLVLTVTGGGGGVPAGNDTEIQFNDGGIFGSDSSFTFDKNSNTLTTANLSGSLTRLSDGTSYLIAGTNVSITTSSNGSVTIASTASSTGGTGDPNATYLVLSSTSSLNNERVFTSGIGLKFLDGGSGGNYTLEVNDSIVATLSGSTFSGTTVFNAGLTGSLTKVSDGTSYLIAGSNVVITTGSNGAITISSTASGSGAPGGLDTYVQFNDSGNFGGDASFTFNKSTNSLVVTNLSASLTRLSDGSPYLIGGNNILLSSGSNGSITISSITPPTPEGSGIPCMSWLESLAGAVDGVNTNFTVNYPPVPASSLFLFVNGVLQKQGAAFDYALSGNLVSMNYAPTSGSILLSTYLYQLQVPAAGIKNVWMELPSGSVNGSNSVFTLLNSPSPASSLMFFVNGTLLAQGSSSDYVLSGSTITMNTAPSVSSKLAATYQYYSATSWLEMPTGAADGSNSNFTLTNVPKPSSSLALFLNGILQRQGVSSDYILSDNSIAMNYPPNSGSILQATYRYQFAPYDESSISWLETPTGDVDGMNMIYDINRPPTPINSLMFFVNGILQKQGNSSDFTVSGSSIVMTYAPPVGSNLSAIYSY